LLRLDFVTGFLQRLDEGHFLIIKSLTTDLISVSISHARPDDLDQWVG
jgi:hypothetical protein